MWHILIITFLAAFAATVLKGIAKCVGGSQRATEHRLRMDIDGTYKCEQPTLAERWSERRKGA